MSNRKKSISAAGKHAKRVKANRPIETLLPKKRFLIVCEDSKSAPKYFAELRRILRTEIRCIEITSSGKRTDPLSVVKRAKANGRAFDFVWAVFDADTHHTQSSHIPNARNLAQSNNIQLAISNPCFEYWLILHFKEYRKTQQNSKQMEKTLSDIWKKEYKEEYHKGKSNFNDIVKRYEEARKWAKNGRKQTANEMPEQHNPCSEIYLLIDQINKSIKESQGKKSTG